MCSMESLIETCKEKIDKILTIDLVNLSEFKFVITINKYVSFNKFSHFLHEGSQNNNNKNNNKYLRERRI